MSENTSLHEQLEKYLSDIGLRGADCGGSVVLTGADPIRWTDPIVHVWGAAEAVWQDG